MSVVIVVKVQLYILGDEVLHRDPTIFHQLNYFERADI